MEARVEQATSKWQRESETRLRTEAQMERYKSEVRVTSVCGAACVHVCSVCKSWGS